MADVLKADTRFWAVDKAILAYFGFAVAVILGWWSKLAGCAPAAGRPRDCRRFPDL